jgi:acyl-CoA synthetase (AMP-forming)/AMP-acid ligase II
VGRQKDLIIRGGYNVYPREIEEDLNEHQAVAEVAVIGIQDEVQPPHALGWVTGGLKLLSLTRAVMR